MITFHPGRSLITLVPQIKALPSILLLPYTNLIQWMAEIIHHSITVPGFHNSPLIRVQAYIHINITVGLHNLHQGCINKNTAAAYIEKGINDVKNTL